MKKNSKILYLKILLFLTVFFTFLTHSFENEIIEPLSVRKTTKEISETENQVLYNVFLEELRHEEADIYYQYYSKKYIGHSTKASTVQEIIHEWKAQHQPTLRMINILKKTTVASEVKFDVHLAYSFCIATKNFFTCYFHGKKNSLISIQINKQIFYRKTTRKQLDSLIKIMDCIIFRSHVEKLYKTFSDYPYYCTTEEL